MTKVVRHKEGGVLFIEPVIIHDDIFGSLYRVRNCLAAGMSPLNFSGAEAILYVACQKNNVHE